MNREVIEAIMIIVLICVTIIGCCVADNKGFSELWDAGNIVGKIVTIVLAILLLPGIIAYYVLEFLWDIIIAIKDFLFPRKSGYHVQVPYDEATYRALQSMKIHCEHWGQIDIPSSVIVFKCKADWKKALRHFPELTSKAANYFNQPI